MTQYEKLSLVLQVLVAITAFATLGFLFRQIRAMVDQITATQDASRAQNVMSIVQYLQSPESREARRWVRSVLSKKHHLEWSEEEQRHASSVCASYDVMASLLIAKLAPLDLFVVNWGPSIVHCHEVLSPYMTALRSQPGAHPEYWRNFDWLRQQVSVAR